MKRFFALMIGALFLIANAVCSQERTSVPSEGDSVGDTSATKTDSATSCSKTEDSINAIKSQIFEDVLPLLKKAAGLLGNQDALPDKSYLFTDKTSNIDDINSLLDDAVEVLSENQVTKYRDEIRRLREEIDLNRKNIVSYKEKRVSAQRANASKSIIDRLNPYYVTREDLDKKITESESAIKESEEKIAVLKTDFGNALRAIGVDVSDEAVDSILATVSGDDIVTLSVVFDNVRVLTEEFRELTENNLEAPEIAKQYYGMYVILAKILDRVQKTCIQRIEEQYLPKLEECSQKASSVIDEAKSLIANNGGDAEILQKNIRSNELTLSAIENYDAYLRTIIEIIMEQNKNTERIVATATNTYKTVDASANAGKLLADGGRELEKLMEMRMPPLRAFENESLRKEYERLNSQLADR